MSPLPVDIDTETIQFDGRWLGREELARAIRGLLDSGNYNIGRHSAALEALNAALVDVRTLAIRVTPEQADAIGEAAKRLNRTPGAIIRDAVSQFLGTASHKPALAVPIPGPEPASSTAPAAAEPIAHPAASAQAAPPAHAAPSAQTAPSAQAVSSALGVPGVVGVPSAHTAPAAQAGATKKAEPEGRRPTDPEIPVVADPLPATEALADAAKAAAPILSAEPKTPPAPPPGLKPAHAAVMAGPGALRAAGLPSSPSVVVDTSLADTAEVVTEAASPEEAAAAVDLKPKTKPDAEQEAVERRWFGG